MKILSVMGVLFLLQDSDLPQLAEIRIMYHDSSNSAKANQELHQVLKQNRPLMSPEMEGYFAMSYFLMSKYAFNPFKKFEHFTNGKVLMDSIIHAEPENIELRYLRNMVQIKLPSILDYDINIDEDRRFINNNASKIKDAQLRSMIEVYYKEFEKYFEKRKRNQSDG